MNILLRRVWLLFVVILTGCGTFATPAWQASTPASVRVAQVNDAQSILQSTNVPTGTPMPPTPTSEPTASPTTEPTATLEPTSEPVLSPIDRLVAVSDVEKGEELFITLQSSIGFSCSTCHRVDSEDHLIGPGLLNINDRAEDRVEGQSVAEYIFTSIKNPSDYVVEGFPNGVMPQNWSDVYSDSELFDIVAYVMTLQGEAVTEESPTDPNTSKDTPASIGFVELPESADAENGAVLFETFQPDAGFACSTCHNDDSEDRLIGPGLLNVPTRAETRVEGQTALEYIFTSITNPGAFVVPDFPDGLMPVNWAEIYSEDEIYDIIAYLMTLQ